MTSTNSTVKDYGQKNHNLADYAIDTFRPEDAILETVRKRSISGNLPNISVHPMDGLHLEILTRMAQATRAVEIGTLGGYSAICIARGLNSNGRLFTCEVNPDAAKLATSNLKFAGFSESVEVILGPALETLSALESRGPFDLVFIDANKDGYPEYLNWAIKNLRVGGVLIADNTFAWGLVAHSEFSNETDARSARAIQIFNKTLADHKGFRSTLLPTGEGLTVGIKIAENTSGANS